MIRKNRLSVVVLTLSIVISIWLLNITISDFFQKGRDEKEVFTATRLNPLNARPYYYLGVIRHYDRERPAVNDAIKFYKKALIRNPLYSNAWYDLAYAFINNSHKEEAYSAIGNYYKLNHVKAEAIWNTAMFYYIYTENIDNSIKYLKRLIYLYPDELERVLNILLQSGMDNEYIISNILSLNNSFYPGYLKFLMKHNDLERTIHYWQIVNHDLFDRELKLRFCNYLLNNDGYEEVKPLWLELINEYDSSTNLIFNGSFENPISGGCLGWVKQKKEGVIIRRDSLEAHDGKTALQIYFDGKHNVNLNAVRQIILVEPERQYTLSAMIKTENLTTTNGIFLQVYGHRCKGLNIWTDSLSGTNDWTELTMSFTTPSGCRAVVATVRRAKSYKFNNRIKGTAWVDSIKLTKTE